jgi:sulfite reductase (ferredoxin)
LLTEFIPAIKSFQLPKGFKNFDRYGERAKRLKARLKFLLKEIGKTILRLVDEKKALSLHTVEIDTTAFEVCSAIS